MHKHIIFFTLVFALVGFSESIPMEKVLKSMIPFKRSKSASKDVEKGATNNTPEVSKLFTEAPTSKDEDTMEETETEEKVSKPTNPSSSEMKIEGSSVSQEEVKREEDVPITDEFVRANPSSTIPYHHSGHDQSESQVLDFSAKLLEAWSQVWKYVDNPTEAGENNRIYQPLADTIFGRSVYHHTTHRSTD